MTPRAPVAFWFTKQFAEFRFQPSAGTSGPPPPPSGIEYTLSGGGLSELFITTGTLSAPGVNYLLNPMSKRTN